jgi:acyl-coenzyme A synthetase/AMP-(fatty) acid ligase
LIADAAAREPHRPLLADEYGRSLTTRELHDAACRTAAAFAERGIGAGTVVSWQLPTTLETVVVMAALTRLGAVQNPIIPILREHEVGFITGQLATEFFVAPELWRGFDYGGLARSSSSAGGFEVITVDLDTPPVAGELRLPRTGIDGLTPPPGPASETRWIYYSSGTTAAPKGIRHSDASVIAGSAGVVGMVGATGSDVNPIAFPIAHIGGAAMLTAALLTGMRLALFEAFDPAYHSGFHRSPQPDLAGHRDTVFRGVPRGTTSERRSAALPVPAGVHSRRCADHRRIGTSGARSLRSGRHRQRLGTHRVSGSHVAVT